MNGIGLAVLIIFGLIGLFSLYKIIKPYFLRYDTTLCITGGLGSGKTLTSVKTAIVLIRRQRFFKWYLYNKLVYPIKLMIVKKKNTKIIKYNSKNFKKPDFVERKTIPLPKKRKKPKLYSNIPIHFKKHIIGREREWSDKLKAPQLLCLESLREYSVVLIDELPQFVNQFNWNEELIQKNVNEWITYFRHYYAGYLIVNAQATEDVVVQIRRKLNQATWCFNFKKHLLGLFYTVRMCDVMLSDQINTITTTYIEENTKLHYGLFPKKGTYDTRCYSERINNALIDNPTTEKWGKLKTNKVLKLVKYTSPLDDTTTDMQKKEQYEKGEKIWKN